MSFVQAVAFALVGRRLAAGDDSADPRRIMEHLASLGVDAASVAAVQQERRAASLPWPFPLPEDVAVNSPAQLKAVLDAVRTELGVGGPSPVVAVKRRPSADELRLIQEVPPHHGRV